MAPEYLRTSSFSDRSDIFALGVVLWEAVTGRSLFKRQSPLDSMLRASERTIEAASTINPDVPKALDRVIAKCLAPSPGARFASMKDLSVALATSVPQLGTREEVSALVMSVARGTLDQNRRALHAARAEACPQIEASGEYELQDEDILSATFEARETDLLSVREPFEPGEARIFDTVPPNVVLPRTEVVVDRREAAKVRRVHPRFVAPSTRSTPSTTVATATARPKRSKWSFALLAVFVAVICSSTALLVSAGLSEDSASLAH